MEKIKKTVIFFSYACNNRCVFCINYDKRAIPAPSHQDIRVEILKAKKRGSTYLELIGGEPTIDTGFIDLIRFARKTGFRTVMIATNGRMFAYKDFAERVLQAGLNSVIFSIHGHTARLHDSLTQSPGSFAQLRQGVKNVQQIIKKLKLPVGLGTNTTIVKQNYKFLPKIGEYIRSLRLYNAEFIFVDPTYGGAYDDFKSLVPKISDIAPYVRACLEIGKKHRIPHWHIRYVPLCYFQDYLGQISELLELKIYRNVEHVAPDFYNAQALVNRKLVGRAKPRKCQQCRLYDSCEGIWKEYLKRYGDAELKPVK